MTDSDQHDPSHGAPTPVVPGALILQYKIIDRIGAGGMGEVFLAVDTKLNRKVALKFLPPQQALDADSRTRFTREVKHVAALNHPNIVHIYEVSEYYQRPFFAMEHVEGKTLRDFEKDGRIAPLNALTLCVGICEGLDAAHRLGIIHRDIKPANIVIDNTDRVRILDFGVAKRNEDPDLTSKGSTIGTVNYMSPEQVRGQKLDSRSDIFSFGVLFYEMLSGHLPFKGDNDTATILSIINDKPLPLSKYISGLPSLFQKMLDKLLAKDVEKRYQSMSDVLVDVRTAIDFLQGKSAAKSETAQGGKRYGLIAIFALLIVAGIVGLDVTRDTQPDKIESKDSSAAVSERKLMETAETKAIEVKVMTFSESKAAYDEAASLKNKGSDAFNNNDFAGAEQYFRQAEQKFLTSVEIADSTSRAGTQVDYKKEAQQSQALMYAKKDEATKAGASGNPIFASGAKSEDDANSKISAGDFAKAGELYRQAAKLYEAATKQGSDVDAQSTASSARDAARTAKDAADAVTAQDFAKGTYSRATDAQRQGESHFSQHDYAKAIAAFDNSRQLFNTAISESKATHKGNDVEIRSLQDSAAWVKGRIPEEDRNLDSYKQAQRVEQNAASQYQGGDFATATQAYRQAIRLYGDVISAHDQQSSKSRGAVESTIERYRKGLESRSISELKSVYPSMPGDWEKSWRNFFENSEEVKSALTINDVSIQNKDASAKVIMNLSFRVKGKSQESRVNYDMRLQNGVSGWVISKIEISK